MKRVGIAALKARLSEHLRLVRNGQTLVVVDRETPIARIVPHRVEPLERRAATRRPKDLRLPDRLATKTDSLSILLDDRRRR